MKTFSMSSILKHCLKMLTKFGNAFVYHVNLMAGKSMLCTLS